MTAEEPRFLELGDAASGHSRRIAVIAEPAVRPDGRPGLVWLPGFKSDMASTKASVIADWARAEGLAMTRLDYSGHGRSSGRIEDMTIGDWAAEARTVIEQLAEGPQVLIGSSMGGWIALVLARALAGTGRIAGLVLIAPAWDMTERLMWQEMGEAERRDVMERGVWMRPSAYGDEGYPITRRLIEEGRSHLIAGRPFDPACPVRIIQGMADPDVPWQGSIELTGLLEAPDIRLTLVKDGEHRLSRPADLDLLIRTIAETLGAAGAAGPI
ncbi:MAG: alpha/beta hydrolase [Hyphomicrobiaceae bacterium]